MTLLYRLKNHTVIKKLNSQFKGMWLKHFQICLTTYLCVNKLNCSEQQKKHDGKSAPAERSSELTTILLSSYTGTSPDVFISKEFPRHCRWSALTFR